MYRQLNRKYFLQLYHFSQTCLHCEQFGFLDSNMLQTIDYRERCITCDNEQRENCSYFVNPYQKAKYKTNLKHRKCDIIANETNIPQC